MAFLYPIQGYGNVRVGADTYDGLDEMMADPDKFTMTYDQLFMWINDKPAPPGVARRTCGTQTEAAITKVKQGAHREQREVFLLANVYIYIQ